MRSSIRKQKLKKAIEERDAVYEQLHKTLEHQKQLEEEVAQLKAEKEQRKNEVTFKRQLGSNVYDRYGNLCQTRLADKVVQQNQQIRHLQAQAQDLTEDNAIIRRELEENNFWVDN